MLRHNYASDACHGLTKKLLTRVTYSFNGSIITYESQLTANANIGSFYRYVSSMLRRRSAVSPLGDNDGGLITDSFGEATILQQTFANNVTTDNKYPPQSR
jgi:hypothetical protein